MSFKEKFIAFIMKKWTAPIVCGVCIVLIFAMSANSFAKYYTRVQEARAAAVAVYGTTVKINNTGTTTYDDNVKILFVTQTKASNGEWVLPYGHNDSSGYKITSCAFDVTNQVNSKVCETSLSYTITITFPSALPDGVTWTLRGSGQEKTNDTSRTFSNASYTFEAGVAKTVTHYIDFAASTSGMDVMYYPRDKFFKNVTVQITTTQTNS